MSCERNFSVGKRRKNMYKCIIYFPINIWMRNQTNFTMHFHSHLHYCWHHDCIMLSRRKDEADDSLFHPRDDGQATVVRLRTTTAPRISPHSVWVTSEKQPRSDLVAKQGLCVVSKKHSPSSGRIPRGSITGTVAQTKAFQNVQVTDVFWTLMQSFLFCVFALDSHGKTKGQTSESSCNAARNTWLTVCIV